MTKWIQAVPVLFLIQSLHGTPVFKGISFKQDFDISLKPLEFKPFTIIKEKWSPFGVFGKKHVIGKRQVSEIAITDLNGALPNIVEESPSKASTPIQGSEIPMAIFTKRIVPVYPPPVFEKTEPMPIAPLYVTPKVKYIIEEPTVATTASEPIPPASPVSSPAPPLPRVPLIMPPELAKVGFDTFLVQKEIELPPKEPVSAPPETAPVPVEPISPNVGSTDQPVQPVPSWRTQRRLTNIMFKDPAENAIPNVEPTKPPVVPLDTNSITEKPREESTFVKASKIAFGFSQMFVQLMNQFFTNARATIDKL